MSKYTSISVKPETKEKLKEQAQGKETWDEIILRLIRKNEEVKE